MNLLLFFLRAQHNPITILPITIIPIKIISKLQDKTVLLFREKEQPTP